MPILIVCWGRLSFFPQSWMRHVAFWRFNLSSLLSMPSRFDGVFANCSLVNNHRFFWITFCDVRFMNKANKMTLIKQKKKIRLGMIYNSPRARLHDDTAAYADMNNADFFQWCCVNATRWVISLCKKDRKRNHAIRPAVRSNILSWINVKSILNGNECSIRAEYIMPMVSKNTRLINHRQKINYQFYWNNIFWYIGRVGQYRYFLFENLDCTYWVFNEKLGKQKYRKFENSTLRGKD